MPAIAITENFGDLLDARVRKIYDKEYGERIQESMIPMIFGMIGIGLDAPEELLGAE